MRVLLIEDHDRLAGYIGKGLTAAQFTVDRFARGDDGLEALASEHYGAMVLDLRLPDQDGLDVLHALRESGNRIPVLVLTSRVQVSDRVEGLNAGADDYLTKPFAMEELVARLRALLRRPGDTVGVTLSAGNLTFDTTSRQAKVTGTPLGLSRREMALLEYLLRRAGQVVPKQLLEDSLYGFNDDISSNTLEVLVHRLRKKLAVAGASTGIHTVRGVGYLLTEEAG